MNRMLSWLCVGAWTGLLILTIYYSIRLPGHLTVQGVNVTQDLVRRQEIMYVWIAVGLAVALIGVRLQRWGSLTAVCSSLLYLVGWYLSGPMSSVGPIDGYRLMWQTATRFGLYVPFVVRHVLVPGAFVVALAGSFLAMWRRKSIGPMTAR
jgi:hypothetical protein